MDLVGQLVSGLGWVFFATLTHCLAQYVRNVDRMLAWMKEIPNFLRQNVIFVFTQKKKKKLKNNKNE